MGRLNYPTQNLEELPSEYVSDTVGSLIQLSKQGIPKTDNELSQRLDNYFAFCVERSMRPGIESLCLALGTSRQTFWSWCKGIGGKSYEWRQLCVNARQVIVSFIENAGLNGKLNPATFIFCLKNWAGYSDSPIQDVDVQERITPLSTSEILELAKKIQE